MSRSTIRQWLQCWFPSRFRSRLSPRPLRGRLVLEPLEDRWLPSVITWGSDTPGDWDTPGNWAGGAVPTALDDASIPFNNITVTHSTNATDAVHSVNSQADFSISAGSLAISDSAQFGAFSMSAGSMTIGTSAVFNGAFSISGFTGGLTIGTSAVFNGSFSQSQDTMTIGTSGTFNAGYDQSEGSLSMASMTVTGNATLSSGTLSVATSAQLNNGLEFSAGTLTGAGTMTVDGPTDWSGGVMSGSGVTNLDGSSTISGNGGQPLAPFELDTRTLNNFGSVSDSSSPFPLANGAVINNESGATWDLQDTSFNGTGVFNNLGTLTNSSLGTSTIGVAFNNTHTVNVLSGGLLVQGDGVDTGTFNVAGNTTLTFSAGSDTFDNATVAGAGTFVVNGAETITALGNVSIGSASFTFDGSTLTGSGDVTVNSTMTWTNGATMSGSGATVLEGSTTYTGAGTLNTRTLTNGGTLTVSSSSPLVINAPFNNSGTVQVQSGALTVLGDGIDSGTFTVAGGTSLTFSAGSDTFTNGALVNGAGTFVVNGNETLTVTGAVAFDSAGFTFDGSTITGSGTVTVNSATTWNNAVMSGTGETDLFGSTTISGNDTLDTRTLDASSTVTQLSALTLANAAVINSDATWNLEAADGVVVLSGSGTFNNPGTFQQQGSGENDVAVPFNSNDEIFVLTGTLGFNAGGMDSGFDGISAGATLAFNGGTYNLLSASDVSGDGGVRFSGGTVNVAGGFEVDGPIAIGSGSSTTTATANFSNTVNEFGSANFTSLSLTTGGVLTGAATVTVSGATTWTGGTMSGTGETDLLGSTTISGNNTLDMRTLNNEGTVTQNTSALTLLNGAVINNDTNDGGPALWNLTSTTDGLQLFSGSGTFNNNGGILSAASAVNIVFAVPVNNNGGDIAVQSGTLTLLSGGQSTGGIFDIASGATLDFGGGTYNIDFMSFVQGAGNVTFSASTVTVAGAFTPTGAISIVNGATADFTNAVNDTGSVTFTTLSLTSGGIFTGDATVTVTGATTWNGGTMSGNGITVLQGATALSGNDTLDVRTLNNFGVVSDTTSVFLDNGVIDNDPGAVWNLQIGAGFTGSGVFANLGTLNTAGPTNTIAVPFYVNISVVNVQSGTLQFTGGGMDSGSDSIAAGATLAFGNGPVYNLAASSDVTGGGGITVSSGGLLTVAGGFTPTGPVAIIAGDATFTNTVNGTGSATFTSFALSFGTLEGNANITVTGATSWDAGSMGGSGVTNLLGSSTIFTSGSITDVLDTRTLNNFGTLLSTNVSIPLTNGAVINNESGAVWNMQTTDLETGTVNNFGTLNVSGGFNILSGQFPRATITNAGTVTVAGNSTFTFGTYTQTAGTLKGSGVLNGNVVITGGVVSPGFSPGILTIQGDYSQNSNSVLNIVVDGTTAGSQYSVLAVSGAVTLGGTLNIIQTTSFVPPLGAMFQIVTAGSVTGTFATVNGLRTGNGEMFTVNYGATGVVLGVFAPGVASITSPTPSGTYGVGAIITVTVTFNEPVTLSGGNLLILLNDGGIVVIQPFINSLTATGTYTVASGQTANPLDTNSPLVLDAGATLLDAGGNAVALLIPTGASLVNDKTIIIMTGTPISPPPPAIPIKIGVVTSGPAGTAVWTLYSDITATNPVTTFTFGLATDIDLVGDWNGDGFDTVGVAREVAGGLQWSLDTNGDHAYDFGDSVYSFGNATDVPVVGDWTGSGATKIGVVRSDGNGTAEWSLDTNGDGVYDSGDEITTYGLATDNFGAGDWTGNGKDDLAVVRAGAGGIAEWILNTTGTGVYSPSDTVYTFGLATDTFIVGDWNGAGKTEIGVMRPGPNGTMTVTLDTNGDGVYDAGDQVFSLPASLVGNVEFGNWQPLAALTVSDPPNANVPPLQLDATFQSDVTLAISLWAQAGLNSAGLAQLRGITYSVSTLGGGTTALDDGNHIVLDATAGGNGWSEGPTPQPGQIDLVTTLDHEMGHALGFGHSSDPNDVMFATLPTGIRLTPTAADVNAVLAMSGSKSAS